MTPSWVQVMRQQVDIDMALDEKHIRATDKGCSDQGEYDKLGLPDCRGIKNIAHHHHLADHDDRHADQGGSKDAAEPGGIPDKIDKEIHGILTVAIIGRFDETPSLRWTKEWG